MNRTVSLVRFATTLAVLSTTIWSAQAQQQSQPPAREGNIWGGVAHQPTRGGVQEQEKAAGIALPSQQQKTLNQDVDQLYRELMTREVPKTGRPDRE